MFSASSPLSRAGGRERLEVRNDPGAFIACLHVFSSPTAGACGGGDGEGRGPLHRPPELRVSLSGWLLKKGPTQGGFVFLLCTPDAQLCGAASG